MANMQDSKLGLDEAAIRDLAQRLAIHLRVELGDRLLPLQEAYSSQRQITSTVSDSDENNRQ
jgi:hypothetical protein